MKASIYLILALALIVGTAQPGRASTVEEGHARAIPWSGYWWPHSQGAMIGPLAKYDAITGKRAAAWEQRTHPRGPDVPRWHGYCHAWAASSLMEAEPQTVRTAGVEGRIRLSVGDQKGLLAVCHARDVANTYGDRYGDGRGSEDKSDLAPDTLWRLLKLHLKQQGVPLILDIEAGAQVWNYPVYAYRIQYSPYGNNSPTTNDSPGSNDGLQLAQMTLWMADDAVPPDYLGVKVKRHTYTFTFRLRNGSVVMGSGKWAGPSQEDHPDFAWYPYIAVAENPEIDYGIVRQLVRAETPAAPTTTTPPATAPSSPTPPLPATPPSEARPNPVSPGDFERGNESVVSPLELVALIANRTSSFGLDVSVDRQRYQENETFTLTGISDRDGYLYLLSIDSAGDLSVLSPQPGQDNRIRAHREFTFPAANDGFVVQVRPPSGTHRIKAIVTSRPLALTGLLSSQQQLQRQSTSDNPADYREFRWHPTLRRVVRRLILAYVEGQQLDQDDFGGIDPHKILGAFAQDEVAFYVGPIQEEVDRAQPQPKPEEPSVQSKPKASSTPEDRRD